MDGTQRMLIERACERLVHRYAHLIDGGEAEGVAGLFTTDGVWESPERRMAGGDELRESFGARQRMQRTSRHVCTDVVIDVADEDTAEGISTFTLYRDDSGRSPALLDGPVMIGTYHDRFLRTDDGWRFAHRRAEVTFVKREPKPEDR